MAFLNAAYEILKRAGQPLAPVLNRDCLPRPSGLSC